MTRTQIARQMKNLGITTAEDAVAAGAAAISRVRANQERRGVEMGLAGIGRVDRVCAAILYSEFIAESTSDEDLWTASVNAAWIRRELGLDSSRIARVAERIGWYGAGT